MVGRVLKKLGTARTKTPKAVVTRGKGKTFRKNPMPFSRGVVKDGIPTSKELFNVGMNPEIPTANLADLDTSFTEGGKILRKAGRKTG